MTRVVIHPAGQGELASTSDTNYLKAIPTAMKNVAHDDPTFCVAPSMFSMLSSVGQQPKYTLNCSRDKRRNAAQKLLEGILDETERHQIATSVLCVSPESLRGRALRIVRAGYFTFFVSVLILVNAVFIGIETEVRRCADAVKYDMWYVVQVTFSMVFFLELGLRLFAERTGFFYDAWNVFDTFVVLASVADTAVLHHLVEGSTVELLVVLRVVRLTRLARILRLMRLFKELWILLAGIFDAARTLAWAWFLIFLIIYTAAIFATRMYGKNHSDDSFLVSKFGTLPRSMYTLFQVMTGEGWADVARHTMKVESLSWIFFILFIFVTTFAIMHVVVAVIVQNTMEHASHFKEEEQEIKRHREQAIWGKIIQVFEAADTDGDGEMSRSEFLQSLDNAAVLRHLHEIDVDVRQAENLFDILDYDESGSLDLCEFVEGVLRARGEAKAKDVLAVQCDLWRVESRLLKTVDYFSSDLDEIFGENGLQGTLARFAGELRQASCSPRPSEVEVMTLQSCS